MSMTVCGQDCKMQNVRKAKKVFMRFIIVDTTSRQE